jgi:hypothetical protein
MSDINTHVRMFDLVRYCRATLHEDGLITDKEYAWLCVAPMATSPSGGSPSARRLEDYDQLQARIKRLEELVEIGGRMADIGQKIVHQGGEDMYWIRKLEEELTEWAIAKRDDPHHISPHGPVSQKCETTPPSETT